MHCVCLGVVKKITSLWFNKKYKDRNFYVGESSKGIDAGLKNLKPPGFIGRTPRSLSKLNEWKGILIYFYNLFILLMVNQ